MSSPKKHRVLFVCLGNICRSPAGEIIFREMVADAGRAGEFEIDSAGTSAFHAGSPPDARMSAALKRRGFPISGRSRQIQPADLSNFDLILTMDESNLKDVRALDPEKTFHKKIQPLVSFCQHHDAPRIPDPYYGGEKGFEDVIDLLIDASEGILKKI